MRRRPPPIRAGRFLNGSVSILHSYSIHLVILVIHRFPVVTIDEDDHRTVEVVNKQLFIVVRIVVENRLIIGHHAVRVNIDHLHIVIEHEMNIHRLIESNKILKKESILDNSSLDPLIDLLEIEIENDVVHLVHHRLSNNQFNVPLFIKTDLHLPNNIPSKIIRRCVERFFSARRYFSRDHHERERSSKHRSPKKEDRMTPSSKTDDRLQPELRLSSSPMPLLSDQKLTTLSSAITTVTSSDHLLTTETNGNNSSNSIVNDADSNNERKRKKHHEHTQKKHHRRQRSNSSNSASEKRHRSKDKDVKSIGENRTTRSVAVVYT